MCIKDKQKPKQAEPLDIKCKEVEKDFGRMKNCHKLRRCRSRQVKGQLKDLTKT